MNKLTKGQFSILSIFLITSLFLGTSNYLIYTSGKDSYISIIISYFVGFIPLFIYYKLLNYNKKENIISTINNEFKLGKVINLFLLLFTIVFCSYVLSNIINFVYSNYLYETPKLFISILFLICIIYIVNKDITVIGRCATIILLICIFLSFIAVFSLIFKIDITNLKPFFENSFINIINTSKYPICINVLPIFLLLVVPKDNIVSNKNLYKTFIMCYTIGFIFIFIVMFYCITILGPNLVIVYSYPEYQILKLINIVDFFKRMESIISIIWIFNNIITLSLIIYFIKNSITINFNLKNNKITYLISLIILFISNLFKNNTQLEYFYLNILPILSFIFFFTIPFILYIKLKLKS